MKNNKNLALISAAQQAVVAEFGLRALNDIRTDQLLSECVALVAAQLGIEHCKILELLPEGDFFLYRAGVGWQAGLAGSLLIPVSLGTQAGYALRKRRPVLVSNLTREKRFSLPSPLGKPKLLSGLTVVIPGVHRIFGCLSVFSSREGSFSKRDIYFLQGMANVLAAALERERAEENQQQSEMLLNDFFTNVPLGVHWLSLDGTILHSNHAELQMLGYRRAEYIGQHIAKFHADPDTCRELLERLAKKEAVTGYEARLKCKDGSIKYVLIDADTLWQRGHFVHARCFTRDITDRRQREKEILEVSEHEQQRIGQDLHDQLCQYLIGIKFRSNRLHTQLKKLGLEEAEDVREIVALLDESISQANTLARGLCPVEFEAHGLMNALREMAASLSHIFQRSCVCEIPKPVFVYDNTAAFHLYRIAQEAVVNAIKHGRAQRITISLKIQEGKILLAVEDDGNGFAPQRRKPAGLGLHIMQYRARMVGASLAIKPRKPRGTLVTCAVQAPLIGRKT